MAVLLILVWSSIHTHAYIGSVYKFCGCLVDFSMAWYAHKLTHCDMAWYKHAHTYTKEPCLQVVWVYRYVTDWAWRGTHMHFPTTYISPCLWHCVIYCVMAWLQHTCTLAIVWSHFQPHQWKRVTRQLQLNWLCLKVNCVHSITSKEVDQS